MCGIAGIVGDHLPPGTAERMAARLRHRGPDDFGVWSGDRAQLGHTRLAILARETPGEASGRWSLGFEVQDLDGHHARLVAHGSQVSGPKVHAEGFRELITIDPDGNKIRLFSWSQET